MAVSSVDVTADSVDVIIFELSLALFRASRWKRVHRPCRGLLRVCLLREQFHRRLLQLGVHEQGGALAFSHGRQPAQSPRTSLASSRTWRSPRLSPLATALASLRTRRSSGLLPLASATSRPAPSGQGSVERSRCLSVTCGIPGRLDLRDRSHSRLATWSGGPRKFQWEPRLRGAQVRDGVRWPDRPRSSAEFERRSNFKLSVSPVSEESSAEFERRSNSNVVEDL